MGSGLLALDSYIVCVHVVRSGLCARGTWLLKAELSDYDFVTWFVWASIMLYLQTYKRRLCSYPESIHLSWLAGPFTGPLSLHVRASPKSMTDWGASAFPP